MFLVAGEEHAGVEVFTGELLPWRRQVFLLVHPFDLHVKNHMEQLGILLRRVARIELWSERRNKANEEEDTEAEREIVMIQSFNLLLALNVFSSC